MHVNRWYKIKQYVLWVYSNPHSKRNLDPFIRFCRTPMDRQTHRPSARVGRTSLHSASRQCGLKIPHHQSVNQSIDKQNNRSKSPTHSYLIHSVYLLLIAFSALTLLFERQEEHPAWKKWVVGCWRGYLSAWRKVLTCTHCLLLQ